MNFIMLVVKRIDSPNSYFSLLHYVTHNFEFMVKIKIIQRGVDGTDQGKYPE